MSAEAGKPGRIDDLLCIMARLRDPASGCPWDVAQTFATIAPYTIEEAYEVADAIDRNDLSDLRDELGDLLLQVVFHARMAQEQGAFDFAGRGIGGRDIPVIQPASEQQSANQQPARDRQCRQDQDRDQPGLEGAAQFGCHDRPPAKVRECSFESPRRASCRERV